ncbi:NineTeen Complex (NTC) component [Blastocladiella emersonii ATCC 22665]|nr:NineTeen Complex (NTC) component [Blastocladiella emersonii ATCC 22665]
MARNQEKAQSMLFRFREAEMAELGLSQSAKRPPHTKMAATLAEAERWRGQVVREITRKVSRIHDPGLTDSQVRELNDDINKLFKEKWLWERRVVELGGPDYTRAGGGGGARGDLDGAEIAGMKGYKYFGRAKELPGVKEFFDTMVKASTERENDGPKVDRSRLDAEYFGFLGTDPALAAFVEQEEASRTEAHLAALGSDPPSDADLYGDDEVGALLAKSAEHANLTFIPTLADVEALMLERRKQELLAKYLPASSSS